MIVSRTPMRVPLGGGGTDIPSYARRYGGFVISATIDKYSYVVLNPRILDNWVKASHSKTEMVKRIDHLEHDLIREALRLTELECGLDIVSVTDVPGGTGLGSSGAFTVGLLNALHALRRESVSITKLAEEACKIEIDILREPIGKHDQYMAAFGGVKCLDVDRNGHLSVSRPKISAQCLGELERNTLLFYTGIGRRSSGVLSDQDAASTKGEQGVVDCLHRIKEIGLEIAAELERGNVWRFGELMHEHWCAKRRLSTKVSTREIDQWYAVARANGALGGKIVGAGGGGFFVFYCEKDKGQLRRALEAEGLTELPFRFEPAGTRFISLSGNGASEYRSYAATRESPERRLVVEGSDQPYL